MKFATVRLTLSLACALVLALSASSAKAVSVAWDIDATQSSVRLTLPDTPLTISGVTLTARVRDQSSATSWTDAGGRASKIDGFVSTTVLGTGNGMGGLNPTAVTFNGGAATALGVDDKNLVPNPAVWDPGTQTYTDGSSAPAAFGGQLRAYALFGVLNAQAALFSISDVVFDLTGGGAVVGSSITGANTFGISDGIFAVDGKTISALGQTIEVPDLLEDAPGFGGANSGAVSIVNVGGNNWKMTYAINVPISLDVDLDGSTVSIVGSAVGQIVAYAEIVPEPSSIALAGFGIIGLVTMAYRRRRNG